MLEELISSLGLSFFAGTSLLLCMGVFVVVTWRVCFSERGGNAKSLANIPLMDETPKVQSPRG
jgi:hypothetical protein